MNVFFLLFLFFSVQHFHVRAPIFFFQLLLGKMEQTRAVSDSLSVHRPPQDRGLGWKSSAREKWCSTDHQLVSEVTTSDLSPSLPPSLSLSLSLSPSVSLLSSLSLVPSLMCCLSVCLSVCLSLLCGSRLAFSYPFRPLLYDLISPSSSFEVFVLNTFYHLSSYKNRFIGLGNCILQKHNSHRQYKYLKR